MFKKYITFSLLFIWLAAPGDISKMEYPDDFDCISIGDYKSLSEHERVVYCIYLLETQVNNGGFDQFFFNSSGLLTPETLNALDVIGAYKTKHLLEHAVKIAYEDGFPLDATQHQVLLGDSDEVSKSLSELDLLFYRYEDNLTELANQFLEKSGNN